MTPSMPDRLPSFFQHMAVMRFQFVAVLGQQARPILALGHGRRLVERRLRLLVRHLQEQQKRQLLDVIAVGQTVIAEDVAVVPEFLDEGCWVCSCWDCQCHLGTFICADTLIEKNFGFRRILKDHSKKVVRVSGSNFFR